MRVLYSILEPVMTMDFTNLEYFRAVARHGNLSRAAKELYISQPGLSKYLSRLETELGVPLFDRRKGKIELNTYGQVFLANVELAFSQLEKGAETVRQMYSRDQNILSVACSIEDFLVDQLREFSHIHPEIRIRQFSFSIEEMEQQLLRQNLDFAICTHPIQNSRIRYDRLSSCPYVLICHESNPLAAQENIQLSQAADQQFLCESPRLDVRELEAICKGSGFVPHVGHEIVNGYILVNLLEANAGVALVPLAYSLKICRQFPNHHLRFLNLLDDLPLSEIGIAYLRERAQTESAVCFIAFLRKNIEVELEELKKIVLNRSPE